MRGRNTGSKAGYGGSIFAGEIMISPGAQQAGCFHALENGMGGNEAGFEEYIPNQEKQTFWDTFASSKTPQIFEITTLGYNSDQKCIPNQENEPFGIHSPP